MASTQHTPTELEAAGELSLPAADELAGRFPLTRNPRPASPEEYDDVMSTLAFGRKFTDHMAHMLTGSDIHAEIGIVFQSLDGLHDACPDHPGDWYFSGDYPTPGGTRMVNRAFIQYMEQTYRHRS